MENEEKLIWINTTRFCCGVVVSSEGLILEGAPIVKWAVGKSLKDLLVWLQMKNQLLRIERVKDE